MRRGFLGFVCGMGFGGVIFGMGGALWARPGPTVDELAYRALATTQPEAMTVEEAVKALKESKEPMKLVSAAAAIAKSEDNAAGKALQDFLTSEDRIKPL